MSVSNQRVYNYMSKLSLTSFCGLNITSNQRNKQTFIYMKESQIITLTRAVISPAAAPLSTDTTQPRRQPGSQAPLTSTPEPPLLPVCSSPSPPPIQTQGNPLPLSSSLSSFCLPFSSPGSTLNHPPPAISASIPMNAQSPPSPVGWLPPGWGGVKRKATHTNSITKALPALPQLLCMCVCVYMHICRRTQGHGGWKMGVGGLGVVLMAKCSKCLAATQTAPESTVITATSPYFNCISKTYAFA